MKNNDIVRILTLVFAVLILAELIGGGIYLVSASKKLKAIEISPDFGTEQLDVNSEYTFTIKTTPESASIKKAEFVIDDPSASFNASGDGKATLYTGTEGTVTVYIEDKGIKSNVMTFQVVDLAAKAQAEAEAEAQAEQLEQQAALEAEAQALEEAQAPKVVYVKLIKDEVKVRAQDNTDCDVLGKVKLNEVFEKIEDTGEWTKIKYKDKEGFIRNDMITEISEEEAQAAQSAAPEEKKEEEKKEEEKKEETQAPTQTVTPVADPTAAQQQGAADAAALLAQQQAAAAAAGTSLDCADGSHSFSPQQYNFLKGFWQREGQGPDDWKAYAHKHTYDECVIICQIEGGIQPTAAAAPATPAAPAQSDLLAQQQALLAQQAALAAATGTSLDCADGSHAFTPQQYNFLKGFWQREGQGPDDWKAYAHKHTYSECVTICQIEGGIY